MASSLIWWFISLISIFMSVSSWIVERIAGEFNHLEHLNYIKFSHFIFSFHNTTVRGNQLPKAFNNSRKYSFTDKEAKELFWWYKAFCCLDRLQSLLLQALIYFNKLTAFSMISSNQKVFLSVFLCNWWIGVGLFWFG